LEGEKRKQIKWLFHVPTRLQAQILGTDCREKGYTGESLVRSPGWHTSSVPLDILRKVNEFVSRLNQYFNFFSASFRV
jgi:hypothetical protein